MARDVFSVVTGQIVNLLEKGIVPWRRPWSGCGPVSYQSNQQYQGLNVFLLQSEYKSPYWMTFRQAQSLGGSIKAGEHGRYIVFTDSYMKKTEDDKGNPIKVPVRFLRYYTVFNWEQTKGIPEKLSVENENRQIISAQELLIRQAPRIETADAAYYVHSRDTIGLPPLEKFDSSEDYYSAAFHELIHWSGSSLRLNRDGIRNGYFGNQVYSQEERARASEADSATGASKGASPRRYFCAHCRVFIPDAEVKRLGVIGHAKRCLCPKCSGLLVAEPEPPKLSPGLRNRLRHAVRNLTASSRAKR